MNRMISKTLGGLDRRGHRIAAVHLEAGSTTLSDEIRASCEPAIVLPSPTGLNPFSNATRVSELLLGSLRQLVATARSEGAQAIVYMEGDKFTFVPWVEAMAAPILEERADVTLAVRSESDFAQFPWIQRLVERNVNRYLSAQSGIDTDYLYGPRAFSPAAASLFEDYRENDWGVIMYPVMAALARGGRLVNVAVSGEPPPDYMQKYDAIMRSPPTHLLWRSIQNLALMKAARAGMQRGDR